jgi:hypothetical protein
MRDRAREKSLTPNTYRVARVIKSILNQRMRDTMKQVNGLSQEAFKANIIETFNWILPTSDRNAEFWEEIQRRVQVKFWCGISNQSGLALV